MKFRLSSLNNSMTYMISLTLVGTLVSTMLLKQNRNKKGDVMSESKYIADTLKEKSLISEDSINNEVDLMLNKAKKQTQNFDMVRIARPDNAGELPQRMDKSKN